MTTTLDAALAKLREAVANEDHNAKLTPSQSKAVLDQLERLQEAIREACQHQGLPVDTTPERVAVHFRNNRAYREGWDGLAARSRRRNKSD